MERLVAPSPENTYAKAAHGRFTADELVDRDLPASALA